MKLQTTVPIPKSNFSIDYNSQILSMGSCFAENMAEKFEYFRFQNLVNPFGIIFNSVSLEKLIRRAVHKDYFTETDVFYHNERWNCFEVHSELSNSDKDVFLHNLNQIVNTTNRWISESSHIIITLGTAWVYRNTESGEIVANCHKVSQKQFSKELLSAEIMQQNLEDIIALVLAVNPAAKFILTVSPVRHIKDGFSENNVSKAHLLSAVYHVVMAQWATVDYFPSYEIMMDELRDYRFYADDMLHPNSLAVTYIWERFSQSLISEDTLAVMEEVDAVQKGLLHRPFNPNSESYQLFLQNLKEKMNRIILHNPSISF
ncbi:GSCFA domain-containing protein [Flavobacterium enshiense]|uniref:GSCFA domain-containing protein n=1 Tax=Flavobacterium enshiense TaxID=1341165 RepID=UPI00345D4707